jgi:predicted nucleic acid-binding protein
VSNELLAKNTPEGALLRQSLLDFIEVHPDPPAAPRLAPALPDLDPGERQAITLAHHLGTALLMDDRAGRAVAAKCGLIVIGTAGLFVRAKRIGLLTAVVPLLQDLRDSGYWLSDSVVDEARRLAGE